MLLPLLPIQQAMFFDEQYFDSDAPNLIVVPVRIDGVVDPGLLVEAIAAEWRRQPVARLRIVRDALGMPAGQRLDPAAIAGDGLSVAVVDSGPDATILQLRFHHARADRPGIEALLENAVARLAAGTQGADAAPRDASYARCVGALLARFRPVPANPGGDRHAIGPGDPLATSALQPDTAPARVETLVPPKLWTAFADRARARDMTPHLALFTVVARALDTARAGRRSILAMPLSLHDALPDAATLGCFMTMADVATPGTCDDGFDWRGWARDAFAAALDRRWDIAPDDAATSRDCQGDLVQPAAPFDLLFAWHDRRIATGRGFTASAGIALPHPGQAPLALSAQPGTAGLELALDHDPGRIDPAAARALLGLIVDGIAGRTAVPVRLHGPRQNRPPDLLSAIRRHATMRPGAPALLDGDGAQLSYAELLSAADRIAAHVDGLGTAPVVLYGKRTVATFAALLGLLQRGQAFAPCEADAAALPGLCAAIGATDILGDDEPVSLAARWHRIPAILASPAPAAGPSAGPVQTLAPVILFTSGTAGRPRPVVLDPAAIAAQADWAEAAFALTPEDRVLQFNAPGFDAVLEELLPSWSAGAAVVLADPGCTRSGADLLDFCARHDISVLNLPTGFFNLAWQSFGTARWPHRLRLLVIGGEAYTGQAVREWRDRAPGAVRIVTTYGPTEATIDVTARDLVGTEPPGLLGDPRPGVELRVVDRFGRPVEAGLAGELVIGGQCLARGYLGRGADTAARFVPNPAGTGGRLYRTGDRVRLTSEGLRYCGRIDRQFKVAGKRLDPAPIEALIAAACGAAQVRLSDAGGGAGLTAHVAAEDTAATREAIAEAVSALPAWQRPGHLAFGAIPLTARGKVDDRALRSDVAPAGPRRPDDASPGWRLLRDLLSPQVPQPDAPFFASASRSLDVLRLVASCRSQIGRSPSIQDLYLAATTAQVAAIIDRAPTWLAPSDAPLDAIPASPEELAIFADQSRIAGESPYRIDARWTLSAPLDPARLARAVERLRRRYRLLGSRLVLRGDALVWEAEAEDASERSFSADTRPDAAGRPELHLSVSHSVCGAANLARAADELAALYRADAEAVAIDVPHRAAAERAPDAHAPADSLATCEPWQLARLPFDRAAGDTGYAAIQVSAPLAIGADRLDGRRASATALFVAAASAWLARFQGLAAAVVPVAARLPESFDEAGIRLEVCTLPILSPPVGELALNAGAAQVADAIGSALHHRTAMAASLARLVRETGGAVPILLDIADRRRTTTLDFGTSVAKACTDRVPTVRADIELSLVIAADGGLSIGLRGRQGRYDRDTLAHWAASLACFLETALLEPDRPLATIALGGTDGSGSLPAFAAMLAPPAPPAAAEHGLARLLACLDRIGDGPAFCDASRRWHGSEAIAHAAALAARWAELGVRRGEPVCVRMTRGIDYPLALLALWRMGVVPILLSPAHPPVLLEAMERQAGARFRIVTSGEGEAIAIQRIGSHTPADSPPAAAMTPPAYGAFTSGSTGTPKLVLVDWVGFDRLLDWSRRALQLTPEDRFLHTAAAGFDIGLFEMWAPIVAGTPVWVAPPEAIADPAALARLCAERRITHLHLIPTLLAALLDAIGPATATSLRVVLCGGEAVPVALQRRLVERGLALHHCYGPTEASIFALSWFGEGVPHAGAALPLGEPIGGSAVAIVDALGLPTVRGAEGALMLLGDCVARGYHHMPRATAERFRPAPAPWRRAYDTGDCAVMRADGTLAFRGRRDRQVKIAGVRIEPAAVEWVVEAQPGVARAVVVACRRGETKALAAVVLPARSHAAADRTALSTAILDAARVALPPAAVPATMLIVDALPTGPTGKIDYRAIDALVAQQDHQRPAPAADEAETRIEGLVLDLWSQLLGPENRHLDRNFFAAGGTSMTAITLIARLASCGVVVGLGDLFRHPTPRLLARHADSERPAADVTGAPAGTPAGLSPAAAHWLSHQARVDAGAAIVLALDFESPLDAAGVGEALRRVVLRHDALRIRVVADGRGWRTVFANAPRFDCTAHDDPAEAVRAARAQIDPMAGRLVGAALTGAGRRLVLAVHHLGADWHSLQPLAAAVRAAMLGAPPPYAAVPFSRAVGGSRPNDRVAIADRGPRGRFGAARRSVVPVASSAERAAQTIAAVLVRTLRGRGVAHPCIALERDGRTADTATTIGWFTDFDIVAEPGESARTAAADAAVNIVASDVQPAGCEVLDDAVTPVHPIAIELSLGQRAMLTVLADESYAPGAREALADALARALADDDVAIPLPPTSLQRMMLAGTAAYPGKGLYHSQIPFDIVGKADPARLAAAWDRVEAQFETLRLAYGIDGEGRIELRCSPPSVPTAVRIVEADGDIDTAFAALMTDDLRRPFAPDAPLSRVAILHAADGGRMLWSHHHAIADGWSLNIVLQALSQAYAGAPEMPAAASLADYLRWWQHHECDVADLPLGAHIRRLAPELAVPPSFAPADAAAATHRSIAPPVAAAIAALARRRDVSAFELYTSAWALLQARRTGRAAVGFHVVQAVRPAVLDGIEQLAGLCMNQLPFLLEVPRSFGALLGAVRGAMAMILDARTASAESVRWLLHDTIGRGAFESQLIYENYPGDRGGVPLGPDARLVTRVSRERSFARHSLVVLPGDGVDLELLHDDTPAEKEEAQLLMDQFVTIVSQLAALGETADA